jgi:glycosyltransferase involved in cell wall biosynthesis
MKQPEISNIPETEATFPVVNVIIPVYNEVANIGRVLQEIEDLPADPKYRLEVLVVDGGSRDGTAEEAGRWGVRVVQQRGRGYGAACFTGFEESPDAEIVVFLDGDYSDPPASIPALLAKMLSEQADLVLGSRRLGRFEKGALPVQAIWGNRLVAWLIGRLYGQWYSDLPSFKAIRREALASFKMQEMTYGWTVEMLVKAARTKCKIVEVPVDYRRRGGGQSKVSGTFKGTIKAGYFLIKTALSYIRWSPDNSRSSMKYNIK